MVPLLQRCLMCKVPVPLIWSSQTPGATGRAPAGESSPWPPPPPTVHTGSLGSSPSSPPADRDTPGYCCWRQQPRPVPISTFITLEPGPNSFRPSPSARQCTSRAPVRRACAQPAARDCWRLPLGWSANIACVLVPHRTCDIHHFVLLPVLSSFCLLFPLHLPIDPIRHEPTSPSPLPLPPSRRTLAIATADRAQTTPYQRNDEPGAGVAPLPLLYTRHHGIASNVARYLGPLACNLKTARRTRSPPIFSPFLARYSLYKIDLNPQVLAECESCPTWLRS